MSNIERVEEVYHHIDFSNLKPREIEFIEQLIMNADDSDEDITLSERQEEWLSDIEKRINKR